MAKGFTVKAKTPKTTKKEEWDYNKAKEMLKESQLYSVYLDEEFHIPISNHLYSCVLI